MIDLNPTINAAEENHFKADLLAAELDMARLKAELAAPDDPLSAYAPPKEAAPGLLAAQRHYLLTQAEERRAKIAAIDLQKVQKEAEAATVRATIAKLQATVPLLSEKADVNRALIGQKLVSRLAYLETEGKLVEQQEEFKVQRAHLKETEAAIAAIAEKRNHTASEFERTQRRLVEWHRSNELSKRLDAIPGVGPALLRKPRLRHAAIRRVRTLSPKKRREEMAVDWRQTFLSPLIRSMLSSDRVQWALR